MAKAADHRLERARDIFHGPLDTDIGTTPLNWSIRKTGSGSNITGRRGPGSKPRCCWCTDCLTGKLCWTFSRAGVSYAISSRRGRKSISLTGAPPPGGDQFLPSMTISAGYLGDIVEFIRRRHGGLPGESHGGVPGGDFRGHLCGSSPGKGQEPDHHCRPHHFNTPKGLLHIWLRRLTSTVWWIPSATCPATW